MMARGTRITVSGSGSSRQISSFITNYQVFAKSARNRAQAALREIGSTILRNTIPITPLDTGALRESGRTVVERSDKGFRVFVSFGGRDVKVTPTKNAPEGFVDYAIIVHESVDRNFRVGQAKFMEEGFRRSRAEIDGIIARFLEATRVGSDNG